MKHIVPIAALAALAACDVPTVSAPSDAIPFAQVLAENAGKPYECTDYDPRTDTCVGLATYEQTGPNTYLSSGFVIFDPEFPAANVRLEVTAEGNGYCGDFSKIEVDFEDPTNDLRAELMVGQMQRLFQQLGTVCGAYIPSGSGYVFRTTSGPDFATSQPDQDVRFFENPKRLRPGF